MVHESTEHSSEFHFYTYGNYIIRYESITSLDKKVPDLLDYSDNNGLIDYSSNVNDQLYALFGIDEKNQQHIKGVLASKNTKE